MKPPGVIANLQKIYQVYGLALSSEIELPLPIAEKEAPDATVRLGCVERLGMADQAAGVRIGYGPHTYRGEWQGIGAIKVSNGREIVVDADPEATPDTLAPYLLGSALGVLLHQRGRLVLHASAVVDASGKALLFLGHSGQGKSTLAASCTRAGLKFLSDDLAPLEVRDGTAWLYPGPSWMKLWPASLESVLAIDSAALTRIHPSREKRLYSLSETVHASPVEVGNLVISMDHPDLGLLQRRGAAAITELAHYSFCVRMLEREEWRNHLTQCAAVARATNTYYLQRPRDLSRLEEVTRFLLEKLAASEAEVSAATSQKS